MCVPVVVCACVGGRGVTPGTAPFIVAKGLDAPAEFTKARP